MFNKQSLGSHLVGSEIYYSCTATPGIYKVTVKLFRDCSGIQLCANCPSGLSAACSIPLNITGASGICYGTNYGTQTILVVTSQSAYDIVQLCNSVTSICSNCGSRTPGSFSPGVEVYTFEGNVNLTAIPVACCQVSVSYNTCCRNSTITTLVNASTLNFNSEAIINTCSAPCNSSPVFKTPIDFVLCAGQDANLSMGADDPDGDSLSYAFGEATVGPGASAPYVSPYSPIVPLAYLGAPIQSPPANPPVGININKVTGDVFFRPLGYLVAPLVVEVKQWRTTDGVRTLRGTNRRDLMIYSINCPANTPVSIKKYDTTGIFLSNFIYNPYNFDSAWICPGQRYCRVFVASDADTNYITDLSWLTPDNMQGVRVERLYDTLLRSSMGPRQDSIKFCWTPSENTGRNAPYIFTFMARDRKCPVPTKFSHSMAIYVNSPIHAFINKTGDPSGYRFRFTYTKTYPVQQDTALTMWQIESAPGSDSFIVFTSNEIASYQFHEAGYHKIKLTLYGLKCGYVTMLTDSVFATAGDGLSEAVDLQNSFELYPNPSSGLLKINAIKQGLYIQSVALINVSGAVVKKQILNGLNQQMMMDISEYSDGVYHIVITAKNSKKYSAKIVLNKEK